MYLVLPDNQVTIYKYRNLIQLFTQAYLRMSKYHGINQISLLINDDEVVILELKHLKRVITFNGKSDTNDKWNNLKVMEEILAFISEH